MGWPVAPQALHELLVGLRRRLRRAVHDPERIVYLDGHLRAVAAAIADGVDVRGYYVRSLLDDFEWAYGYSKRFGLVYVDHATRRRVPKDGSHWYRDPIRQGSSPWAAHRPGDASSGPRDGSYAGPGKVTGLGSARTAMSVG
nr:family 1 glycosylhydrolase [Streptomyces sp. NRRL S-1022]